VKEILVPLGGANSVFDIVDIGKRNAGGGDLADMLRYMSTRLPKMFAVSL
jgi:hypothetical protein